MLALIAAALLSADVPPAPAATPQEYQAAKAAAGRSPDDQVRLAYWCEAHGLSAERLRHLAQAVLADPNHAAARGLLGLVSRADRWVRPEAVAEQVRADAALAATLEEYGAKRSAAPYTADGQWALGLWADEHGLRDQAKAHYTAVVRLDPRRDVAWKRLGYARHDGHWRTDAEVAAARADSDAQKAADAKWHPLLERWRADLARPSRRAEAEAGLRSVVDPRAVPMAIKVFGAREADGPVLVQLLGQVDDPAASRTLAALAAAHPAADIRRVAAETLRTRDPREFANLLIARIVKPIRYEVKPVNGPGSPGVLFVEGPKANLKRYYEPKSLIQPTDRIAIDRFGQPIVEHVADWWAYSRGGRAFNPRVLTGYGESYADNYGTSTMLQGDMAQALTWQRFAAYQQDQLWNSHNPPAPPGINSLGDLTARLKERQQAHPAAARTANVPLDLSGGGRTNMLGFNPRDVASMTSTQLPLAQAVAESNRSAQASQQQLDQDVAELDRHNRAINDTNDRMTAILNDVSQQHLPADRAAWERWWVDMLGYALVEGQTPENPTIVEVVPSGYQPQITPNVVQRQVYVNGVSCFGAGTPVRTLTGPRPIEELEVGDLVLTQSTTSGALGYRPITVTHHNPPAGTFWIKLGDDTIVSSHFHRFWVARRGWVMARDLKSGDTIRTLGGVRAIDSIEAGKVELVYNLDIADDADFFAGASAALVHDNTLPDPRLVPFDLPTGTGKAVAAR